MDDRSFDAVVRRWASPADRRGVMRGLAACAAGALMSPFGLGGAVAAECRGLGIQCRNRGQCCTRRCGKNRCKCPKGMTQVGPKVNNECRAYDGVCPQAVDHCATKIDYFCHARGTGTCECRQDVQGNSVCVGSRGNCEPCTASEGCEAGEICLRMGGLCPCDNGSTTGCAVPCGAAGLAKAAGASGASDRPRKAGN